MNFKSTYFAIALIVVLFSCSKNESSQLAPVASEKAYPETVENSTLDELAQSFAKSLAESPEMRELVKTEALKMTDGDYEVLYSEIAEKKIANTTVNQLVYQASAAKKSGLSAVGFAKKAASIANFQLAVPVNIESWEAKTTATLVTYMPVGVNDTEVKWLKAYDAAGKIHWLDARVEPNFPVIVIGSSERRLTDGAPDPRFKKIMQMVDPDDGGSGGGGGTTGGSTSTTTAHYCDRAYNTGKYDYITYAKFQNIDRKRDVEPWALGEAEMYVKVLFATPQGSVSDVKYGVWNDWGNTNWIGEYFTKEVNLNCQAIKWDRAKYGDVMKYVWMEEDGGNWGTITVTVEPKAWGVSLGKVEYKLPIQNNDDWAGEQIVEWTDVEKSNSKGYRYDTYYMYWHVAQK